MFQGKATLVMFLGVLDNYPCHFEHKVGDEVIFDGEKHMGRLCPDVWPMVTSKVAALHAAGPRYVEPGSYYPFWYAPCSKDDPAKKKYDGLGYRNVLKTVEAPPYHMANLTPPNAIKWPPHPEGTVERDAAVICPDLRSSAVFALEAFDLSEKGFDTPYFRRQMVILDKVLHNPGIESERVLDTFSKQSREKIYPPLSPQIMGPLTEELELLDYLKMKNSKAFVTKKGEEKLKAFKSSLSGEEREALEM